LQAVSKELQVLITQLQALPALGSFALAGGTNLALRYNHRISVDIDFFVPEIVGGVGLRAIQGEIAKQYNDSLLYCEVINAELGDQYCFLRAFIGKGDEATKIEVLQNMKFIDPVELYKGIKLLSKKDIGLFKLMSASNRKANKDIYDLDLITDEIQLDDLMNALAVKKDKYKLPEHRCLFDLDHEVSPLDNLTVLLEFDSIDYNNLPARPSHSNDRISIVPPSKEWKVARNS
jgi:hypothetical protein